MEGFWVDEFDVVAAQVQVLTELGEVLFNMSRYPEVVLVNAAGGLSDNLEEFFIVEVGLAVNSLDCKLACFLKDGFDVFGSFVRVVCFGGLVGGYGKRSSRKAVV